MQRLPNVAESSPVTAETASGVAAGPVPSVLFTTERIQERVRQLGAEICAGYPAGCELHLLSVLKGGVVFVADLMRALARPVTVDFVRLASYGSGTRPSGPPRLTKDLDDDVGGRDVLIVEDLIDTGRTLARLIDLVRARRPRSLRTVALMDKPSRREVEVVVDHVGFTIPDRFVVGYGLDYGERYRDLPYIGVLDATAAASPASPGRADRG